MNRWLRRDGRRASGWGLALGVKTLAAVLVLAGTGTPAGAQEERLPTAEDVLDRAVEALGGKAALEKHHTRVSKGTFEIPAVNQKGTLVSYEAAPNKFYQAVELPGGLKSESGSDGEVYWDVAPQGARILEGEEKAFKVRDSRFNAPLYWRSLYQKVECVGVENVDDHPCYKVVMTPEVGAPQTCYYDRQSFRMLRMDVVVKLPQGPLPAVVRFDDYKKVDGVLIPHKITQRSLGLDQILTVDTIECNVDIPAERFAPPEPVKALLEKSKTTTKPAAPEKGKP
jgi:hypothetical protein